MKYTRSFYQLVGQTSQEMTTRRPGTPTVAVKKVLKAEDSPKAKHDLKGEGLGRRPWLDRFKDPEEGAQVFPGVEEWTETTSGE